MLKGNVNASKQTVFHEPSFFFRPGKENYEIATKLIELYDNCCKQVKTTTLAWMIVSKRLKVYRDIAQLIGKMVCATERDLYIKQLESEATKKIRTY